MDDTGKNITFRLEGLQCTGCITDMENVLLNTDGILSARVNYQEGTIDVSYDPEDLTSDQVFLRVESLGFKTKKNEDF